MEKNIPELRKEIDQIHKELFALLARRREVTMAVWKIKKEQGLPFYDAEREEQIIQDFVKLNSEATGDPAFQELLKGVMQSVLQEYQKYLLSKYNPR